MVVIDKEKAILIISDLNEAMFKAKIALSADDEKDKRIESLKKHLTDRHKELQELNRKYYKNYMIVNRILPLYERECGRRFEIYPDCDGTGGVDWTGEEGEGGFEPCTTCKEIGVIVTKKKGDNCGSKKTS